MPYRGVSVQPYDGEMTEAAITAHLMGREAYRRTNVIVLRGPAGAYALAAIRAQDREPLFAPIDDVEVVALPDTCRFIVDPETDCANRSALARLAERYGIGPDGTLICQGKYDHVNFIHHPDPLVIRVVEVSPPDPPKLFHMIEHVLSLRRSAADQTRVRAYRTAGLGGADPSQGVPRPLPVRRPR